MARRWLVALAWWCAVSLAVTAQAPPAANPLQTKCQEDFGKLTDCMDYATGHAGTPSSTTCCADAGATQKSRARVPLLHHPADLLHLTPSSPDYAIFANASKVIEDECDRVEYGTG
ncbi:hypothetical protein PR202_ga21635 [Eleusine coracana subsp. coracana]|uniref:Uncharacterized protein n=1 Tax=Eleusine coracana subsp. coracana TaxID=191504 RepID=A0AAV5D1H7_ELECO|nr:hypothetical protein PR202_ga21635 [Eleusine coracana subsp. coracana]